MILQSLTAYYDALVKNGKVPCPGMVSVHVSYAIELDENGKLLSVYPLESNDGNGKLIKRFFSLPAPVKRTVGVLSNFLCDNSAYFLGMSVKDAKRAKQCFKSAAALHNKILESVFTPEANAVKGFFNTYDTENPPECILEISEKLSGGANIVFMYEGMFVHEDAEIREAWLRYYNNDGQGNEMLCLVTGKRTSAMLTHPSIKGVMNAQSSGAALVSFNATAYQSFGREQNLNAPVGKDAAFAYTTALNYLLANDGNRMYIGGSTMVYWAESAENAYQDMYKSLIDGGSKKISDTDLKYVIKRISQGYPVEYNGTTIEPESLFCILLLSPNAARISVRLYLKNTFGTVTKNIEQHYERLKIVGIDGFIPLWRILNETVIKTSGKASAVPSSHMSGDVLRSILNGIYYPSTLYQQLQLRIRADKDINGIRAAAIKAYLLKNSGNEKYKEVITVKLNEDTTYQPYILGRMFSVLEFIQGRANPGINATIKDKYFTSACATPAVVFPTLLNLAEKHLRKLDAKTCIYCSKLLNSLTVLVTESYPVHLTLYDQGIFQLGYYHQTQKRYDTNKNEENK